MKMGKVMYIRDKRLKGNPPAISPGDNLFEVDDKWKLADAFLWVKNYAGSQSGLDVLNILCHGYYGWEDNVQLQMCIAVGGYGLQLCKEGLVLGNIGVAADQ